MTLLPYRVMTGALKIVGPSKRRRPWPSRTTLSPTSGTTSSRAPSPRASAEDIRRA